MNVLVFDMETIPDCVSGRRLYALDGLSDGEVAKVMFAKRVQQTGGTDWLPPHLQKVVAVSGVLRTGNVFKVWSLGDQNTDEKELITRFCRTLHEYSPTVVGWNRRGVDLPVLHYRSLVNRVPVHRYQDHGEENREATSNPSLDRLPGRHIDLRAALSGFNLNVNAAAPLDEIAVILGFPGKLGMSRAAVWDAHQQGRMQAVRQTCETDALKTFLVYLRWELIRGNLSEPGYEREIERARVFLERSRLPHFGEFLQAWNR